MSQKEADNLRQEEAGDPTTSAMRLEALSAVPCLRSIVAGNPAASVDLLARLAQDEEVQVREAVAGNPNTPWMILEQLAWEFPCAFLHNPMGQLQMIAHPEQINTRDEFWNALLREKVIPSLWWNWLSCHPTLHASQAMRLHVQYAGETAYPYGTPQEEDARVLFTLVELLLAAAERGMSLPVFPDNTPGQSALAYEQIVREHLQWLAQSSDVSVRQEVASHQWVPVETLQMLAQDQDRDVLRIVAASQRAPEEVLRTLARNKIKPARYHVAGNQQTPLEVLRVLAEDQDAAVREAVARNQQTPEEVLRMLAKDEVARVRVAAGGNVQTPLEVLQALAEDQDVRVRAAVARNAQASAEMLLILAEDQDEGVRYAIARNQRMPEEVLQTLAQDQGIVERSQIQAPGKGVDIRRAVATNPRTPIEVLQILARDQDASVREATANNLRVPEGVLRTLAEDKNASVRNCIARHSQIPVEVLRVLAQDQSDQVRVTVAWHPRTPVEVLAILARDQDVSVRYTVARNARTPVEVLTTLAQDQATEVRMEVIGNAQTPKEVLRSLAQDQDKNIQWVATLVERLLSDSNERLSESEWNVLSYWDDDAGREMIISDADIDEQLNELDSEQNRSAICQTVIAALAADWTTPKIQKAFTRYGNSFADTLRIRRKHYECLMAPFLPPIALQKLATSSRWEVRYLVALHRQTPWEVRQHLSQDGNRYVRAIARANLSPSGQTESALPE